MTSGSTGAAPRPGHLEWLATLLAFALVLGLRLVWPGDTQWINDEPRLLSKAALMLSRGELAGDGLRGTVGLTYGPIPVWGYAAMLRLTSDLLTLVVLRTALFGLFLAGGLLWLAAVCRSLRPLAAVLLLLSPYAWLYARQLWDNTWLIPLGALALAAYGSFCKAPARWSFGVTLLALSTAVLVHPMVMPLVLAIVAHALLHHRRWLWDERRAVAALAVGVALLALPWLVALVRRPPEQPFPGPLIPFPFEPAPHWLATVFFPLLGGRVFSACGLDYFLEDGWLGSASWGRAAALVSTLGYLLVWAGAAVVWTRLRRARRDGAAPEAGAEADLAVGWVCLVALGVQWVMQVALGRNTHPHYYNGTWICFGYLLWTALSVPLQRPALAWVRSAAAVSLAVALSLLTAHLATRIHRNGGTRGMHFGATLQNQLDIARGLSRLPRGSHVQVEVQNQLLFPHAMQVLRELAGGPREIPGPQRMVRLRYRDPDPSSGWIELAQ